MKLNPPLQDPIFLSIRDSLITNPTWIRFFETVGGSTPPSGGVTALGNMRNRGVWVTGTFYYINDIVKGSDEFYFLCTRDHTANASTEPPDGDGWANVWDKFGGITATRKYSIEKSISVSVVNTLVSSATGVIAEVPIDSGVAATVGIGLVGTPSASTGVATFTNTAEVTISTATPAVVTLAAHGLANGTEVFFRTSGALNTPLAAFTHYFIVNRADDTFQLAATVGGTAINTTAAGSGVHRLWVKD